METTLKEAREILRAYVRRGQRFQSPRPLKDLLALTDSQLHYEVYRRWMFESKGPPLKKVRRALRVVGNSLLDPKTYVSDYLQKELA